MLKGRNEREKVRNICGLQRLSKAKIFQTRSKENLAVGDRARPFVSKSLRRRVDLSRSSPPLPFSIYSNPCLTKKSSLPRNGCPLCPSTSCKLLQARSTTSSTVRPSFSSSLPSSSSSSHPPLLSLFFYRRPPPPRRRCSLPIAASLGSEGVPSLSVHSCRRARTKLSGSWSSFPPPLVLAEAHFASSLIL